MSARHAWLRRAGLALALAALAGAATARASNATRGLPDWLEPLLAAPMPAAFDTADAVVLLDEHLLSLNDSGEWTEIHHRAVRVMRTSGRRAALAEEAYVAHAGSAPRITAWSIPAGDARRARVLGDAADAARSTDPLASDARFRYVDQTEVIATGDVFAWESTMQSRAAVTQTVEWLGDEFPVVTARGSCTAPNGWTITTRVVGDASVRNTIDAGVARWEAQAIPGAPAEPGGPPWAERTTRLMIDARPPAGTTAHPTFGSWRDVGVYLDALRTPSATNDAALTTRARALVAGAGNWSDSVAAIGRFVQRTHYVSIELRLAAGGGFTPRPASEVLASAYGDCKDKANLMCVMLGAVGIDARPLLVNATEPGGVLADWPSPILFDHCIVAVALRDSARVACRARDGARGAWLVFDPTDPATCFGDLPQIEQGAHALLVGARSDSLLTLPRLPAGSSRLTRRIDARLDDAGACTGTLRTSGYGQAGAALRAEALAGPTEMQRAMEDGFGYETGGGSLDSIRTEDEVASGRFERSCAFTIPHAARHPTDRMLTVRPALLPISGLPAIGSGPRRTPLDIGAACVRETIEVALPGSWSVDELPPPIERRSALGSYASRASLANGHLLVVRSLDIDRRRLEPARIEEWRQWVLDVVTADGQSVVLVKP